MAKFNALRSPRLTKLDAPDPISQYAAKLEKELDASESRNGTVRQGLAAGTIVAMEFVAVYDDGSKRTVAVQPLSPVVLHSGSDITFQSISLRVD